jgi:signal peptidase II
MKLTRLQAVWLLVALVLLADQALKIWIKLHYALGESHPVLGSYLQFHFIENEGMAFGIKLPGEWGKLALSLFRILAVVFIGRWMNELVRESTSMPVLFGLGLIFAGALGNIVDSTFYGMIFSESDPLHPARLFPAEGGYGSFLHGHVVDMLRMELFDIRLFGRTYHFFEPIFNLADAAISIGVVFFLAGNLFSGTPTAVQAPDEPASGAARPDQTEDAAASGQPASEGPSA